MIPAAPRRRYRLRLINPRSPLSTITIPGVIQRMTLGRQALFAPTGLMICAAVTPEHWDVELIDECVTDRPHCPAPDCDVVGISAMTTQAKRAYELLWRKMFVYGGLGLGVPGLAIYYGHKALGD
jgi:hypothetical protein